MPITHSAQDYLEGVRKDEVAWVGHAGLNLRYLLYVPLQPQPKHTLLVIGKNPSAATAKESDHTVNQIIRYVQESGQLDWVEQIIVANLYAYYETYSQDLIAAQARLGESLVIGLRNDEFIAEAARKAEAVIVAWGGNPVGATASWMQAHYDPRARSVLKLLPPAKLRCVRRRNKNPLEDNLHPFHPQNWSARHDSVCLYRKPSS
ncbi:DUF1643 domain-containing protein [Corallococcus exiguus]|uniref:DUF1643 domain-containing protein n=1 Tax=Corallococcus exiguus TaxID=83462 RepID=UPI0014941756|nr:DUF1643 domain-containing protein [Corallococcus exiguus]NPC69893.1 DUF1643 domain-containing protein [Corallococcus exiguus]